MIGIRRVEGVPQPLIVGGIGVGTHERVVDGLVASENLFVPYPLVVVPVFSAFLWYDGP